MNRLYKRCHSVTDDNNSGVVVDIAMGIMLLIVIVILIIFACIIIGMCRGQFKYEAIKYQRVSSNYCLLYSSEEFSQIW